MSKPSLPVLPEARRPRALSFPPPAFAFGQTVWIILRLLILGGMLGYIGWVLYRKEDSLTALYQQWRHVWHPTTIGWAAVVVLLMPVNWLLEARKWRLLAGKIGHLSLADALKGVFAGLSFGFITPNTLGDYAARVWLLKHPNRLHAIGAVMLGRVAQLYVTLVAGLFALMHFLPVHFPQHRAWLLLTYGTATLLLLAGGLFIVSRQFLQTLLSWSILQRFAPYFAVIHHYRPVEIGGVLFWAIGRYGVFTGQFLLLLYIFGVRLPIADVLTGTGVVYLAKSVVPAFHFLSDLGVREFSALYIFQFYPVSELSVLSATLSLWLLNILLPAVMGLVWLKVERTRK